MPEESVFVGIDVSKRRLDLAVHAADTHWSTTNDGTGIAALVARLRSPSPRRWSSSKRRAGWSGSSPMPCSRPACPSRSSTRARCATSPAPPGAWRRPTPWMRAPSPTSLSAHPARARPRARPRATDAHRRAHPAAASRRHPRQRAHPPDNGRRRHPVAHRRPCGVAGAGGRRPRRRVARGDRGVPPLAGASRPRCRVCRASGRCWRLTLVAEVPQLGHLGRKEIAALVGAAPLNRDSGRLARQTDDLGRARAGPGGLVHGGTAAPPGTIRRSRRSTRGCARRGKRRRWRWWRACISS